MTHLQISLPLSMCNKHCHTNAHQDTILHMEASWRYCFAVVTAVTVVSTVTVVYIVTIVSTVTTLFWEVGLGLAPPPPSG